MSILDTNAKKEKVIIFNSIQIEDDIEYKMAMLIYGKNSKVTLLTDRPYIGYLTI